MTINLPQLIAVVPLAVVLGAVIAAVIVAGEYVMARLGLGIGSK